MIIFFSAISFLSIDLFTGLVRMKKIHTPVGIALQLEDSDSGLLVFAVAFPVSYVAVWVGAQSSVK